MLKVLATVMASFMTIFVSCRDEGPDWTPFLELARNAPCADIRNRVFVIDESLVLIDLVGNCADASYSQTLYGDAIDDVLCFNRDSIAGPQQQCPVPVYTSLFSTIIANLDQPDLGLGFGHTVRQLRL